MDVLLQESTANLGGQRLPYSSGTVEKKKPLFPHYIISLRIFLHYMRGVSLFSPCLTITMPFLT